MSRKSSLLFLGSGSSTGSPNPFYLMRPEEQFIGDQDRHTGWLVSRKAVQGDPAENKNYRGNPCLLIRYRGHDNESEFNILIDCGKTFREAAIRWFPRHDVENIDAVLLSHGHADAIFGLDDIRGVQDRKVMTPIPIYLSAACMETAKNVLGYLMPKPVTDNNAATRIVASLSWNVVEPYSPVELVGFNIYPIPVMHGEDMISFGFLFGEKERICYISDISRMPPEGLQKIMEKPIDLLVVDALFRTRTYMSHFSLPESIEFCRIVRAKKSLLIGMSCDIDHDEVNLELSLLLESEGLDIQLSYDGLCIDVDL